MARELLFKELPFAPVNGQAIYVEQSYDDKLNRFIRNNYEWLKTTFRSHGLEFCFLPLLAEEAIAYNAPYLTSEELDKQIKSIPYLPDYLAHKQDIAPSLVFALDVPVVDANGNTVLQAIPIETKWYIGTKSTFTNLVKEIKSISKRQRKKYQELLEAADGEPKPSPGIRYSLRKNSVLFSVDTEENADSNFDIQSQLLIDEIKQRIEALRNRGVNTMFLHDLIDEGEHLSRLRITKDFRIFLVDYDNLEIKLSVLPKAVFILFLRHPEGIRFKELTDYYSELLQIYLKMNPNGGRSKQEQSIRDITDPCSNSINEKCARIREAFVSNFDDRLAKNYYVTGKRGEAKRITLDESMILWE
ncbi:MAG: hypothetical protein ACI31D_03415 [Candidatus Limisoma sp.]